MSKPSYGVGLYAPAGFVTDPAAIGRAVARLETAVWEVGLAHGGESEIPPEEIGLRPLRADPWPIGQRKADARLEVLLSPGDM